MFDPGPTHVRCVLGRVALGQDFSPRTSVTPCQYYCTSALYSSHLNTTIIGKDKRAKSGNHETKECASGYRRALDRKILSHFFIRDWGE